MNAYFKLSCVLCALLACSVNPGRASEQEVEKAEKQFQAFVDKYGENSKTVAYQQLNLSGSYQRNGRRRQAEECFQKALRVFEADGSSSAIADALLHRATDLSYTRRRADRGVVDMSGQDEEQADRAEAEKLYRRASLLLEPLPIYDKKRLKAYKLQISFLQACGRKTDADSLQANLEQKLISEAKLVSTADRTLLADEISVLAERALPLPRFRGQAASPPVYKQENFARSQQLRLLALKLYEESRKLDRAVETRRNLVLFYERLNMIPQAEAQMKILSKQLGTNDPKLLFPPPAPCYACGMG